MATSSVSRRAAAGAKDAASGAENAGGGAAAAAAAGGKAGGGGGAADKEEDATRVEAPVTHLALAVLAAAPTVVPLDPNPLIVATASAAVFAGAHRSVKPAQEAETVSQDDAMKFPLMGSAVLVGLFVALKFVPKELLNLVLSAYFVLLGIFALSACLAPLCARVMPESTHHKLVVDLGKLNVPYLLDEPLELKATAPELAAFLVAAAFCGWYFAAKHWIANNALGLAFSLNGIELIALGSTQVGLILLAGLFVYDIFMVFGTEKLVGESVMVTVAKSIEAPIKLLFPRPGDDASPFSMLGLGDIVVPGLYVALMLRYDASRGLESKPYFRAAFVGYVLGLGMTIVVMNVFKAAQPALLYICPAVAFATLGVAVSRGELRQFLAWEEGGAAEGGDGDGSADAGAAEATQKAGAPPAAAAAAAAGAKSD